MHACYYALAWDKYETEKKTVFWKDPVYVKKNSEMWNDFVVAIFFWWDKDAWASASAILLLHIFCLFCIAITIWLKIFQFLLLGIQSLEHLLRIGP